MTADAERLAAIRGRLEAATPGPWRIGLSPTFGPQAITRDSEGLAAVQDRWVADVDASSADARLIAHAPEDIAYLLSVAAERDALRARIDAAPHDGGDCSYQADANCTCWKSAALAGDQPEAAPARQLRECAVCGEKTTMSNATPEWERQHNHTTPEPVDERAFIGWGGERPFPPTPEPPHLDPEPWVNRHAGTRQSDNRDGWREFDPRPADENGKAYSDKREDYERGSV